MKRFFHFMPIAVAMAAATIISCQKVEEEANVNDDQNKEEQVVEEPSIASLTFTISDNEATKTVIADDEGKKYADWETGDKIGYVTSKSDKGSTTVTTGTPATFTISPTSGLSVDDVVNVWYPYRKDESNKASVQMVIPVYQVQSGDTFNFDAMPMVAEPITITSEMLGGSNYAGTINFANLASLIEFKVFSTEGTYASEKVVAIAFDAGSSNIAGHFNMNVGAVNFGTPSTLAITGYTGKSVTTTLASAAAIGTTKESAKKVYMVVAPGTYSGNITVITDAAFYTIPISGKEFERSGFKSFGIDLAKSVATRRSLKGSTTIQLNQISYASADTDDVMWEDGISIIDATEGTSNANNYLPPQNNSSRFYKDGTLSFTTGSKQIEKVVFTATTESYASALAGSTWDNATASASETTVTVRPIDGSTDFSAVITGNNGHTKMQIYYDDNMYSISGASDPVAGGTFTIKKGSSTVTEAKVNTTITLAAEANSGYIFTSWAVKDAENNVIPVVSNEFQMPASDVTVTANFAEESASKTISITPPSNGTVSTSPSGTVAPGTLVTITATPNTGYVVGSVSVVDEDSGIVTVTSNQFTMPAKNVTVTVTFARVYSVVFNSTTNQAGISSYTSDFNTISDGITVACHNFNNNNSGGSGSGTWDYIQAGAKKADKKDDTKVTTGTITTSSAISVVIKKVIVSLEILRGSATGKLYVASNAAFTENLQTIDIGTLSTGDKVFSIPVPTANRYYKLEFVCSNTTTTNGVVKVSEIQYSTAD